MVKKQPQLYGQILDLVDKANEMLAQDNWEKNQKKIQSHLQDAALAISLYFIDEYKPKIKS